MTLLSTPLVFSHQSEKYSSQEEKNYIEFDLKINNQGTKMRSFDVGPVRYVNFKWTLSAD